MGLPPSDNMFSIVLGAFASSTSPLLPSHAYKTIVNDLSLSNDDLTRLSNKGKPLFKSQFHRALAMLQDIGYLEKTNQQARNGELFLTSTEKGENALQQCPNPKMLKNKIYCQHNKWANEPSEWDLLKEYYSRVKSHTATTREKRRGKFQYNMQYLQEYAAAWGVTIKQCSKYQFQFIHNEYLANYYPNTKKLFFQQPALTKTVQGIKPEDALYQFLMHVESLSKMPELLYKSSWAINQPTPDAETITIVTYILPQVRKELARLYRNNPNELFPLASDDFESVITELFWDKDFRETMTSRTRDGEKDVIAAKNREGQLFIVDIETKKWITSENENSGIRVIREIVSLSYTDRPGKAMAISSSGFIKPADIDPGKLSADPLELADKNELLKWMKEYDGSSQS